MIAQVLSSVPGSSAYLTGGAIVYSNDEKVRQLGVDPATIAEHGAVSEAVVAEMATTARARFGVDLTVAVSGIAGPDGGSAGKPVGTVWLAVAKAGRDGEDQVITKLLTWPGARDMVRTLATWWALAMLREALHE
jgi:nicotinamide-nucleotide amidase